MRFTDRVEAGRLLGERLRDEGLDDPVVLGLPRGGVVVAAEVARMLGAPLDALLVRKVGVPGDEEHAMGAVASGGVRVLNETVLAEVRTEPADVLIVDCMLRNALSAAEVTGLPMAALVQPPPGTSFADESAETR